MNTEHLHSQKLENGEQNPFHGEKKHEAFNPYKNFKSIQNVAKRQLKTLPQIQQQKENSVAGIEHLKTDDEKKIANLIQTGKIHALMQAALKNPALFEKSLME